MPGCYIIVSKALNQFYIGATHEAVDNRILKHNQGVYEKTKFTSKTNDWELFLFIECDDYKQAMKIERHIKRMKSKVYINNLSRYPEMILKLKERYKQSGGRSR